MYASLDVVFEQPHTVHQSEDFFHIVAYNSLTGYSQLEFLLSLFHDPASNSICFMIRLISREHGSPYRNSRTGVFLFFFLSMFQVILFKYFPFHVISFCSFAKILPKKGKSEPLGFSALSDVSQNKTSAR